MAAKRVTLMEDVERLAETVYNREGVEVTDFDTFAMKWESYMGDLNDIQQKSLRFKVFDALRKDHPDIKPLRSEEVSELKKSRAERRKKARRRSVQEFRVVGKQQGAVVFSRETFFERDGKSVKVFRDERGRFVSVKKDGQ